jgi:hypothetical protein
MQYDFFLSGGFRYLEHYGFKITKFVVDSQRFFVQARKDTKSVIFVDTLNYTKSSLAEIGKTVGLDKLEIDFSKCKADELVNYCKRDVEILKRFVLKLVGFVKEHDLGSFKPTIAGLAFNAFRHRFMNARIYIHRHPEAQRLEIESYRGGRNECFYIGRYKGKVYALDVNSMYPFVMLNNGYPVMLTAYYQTGDLKTLEGLMRDLLVIARLRVRVNEPVVGVKHNGKLVFPIGTFEGVFTSPEIQLVREYGKILEVKEIAGYEPARVFFEYVSYFHRLKTEYEAKGDMVFRSIAKLYLNSLYGKFGQRLNRYTLVAENCNMDDGIYSMISETSSKPVSIWVIDGRMYMVEKEEPSENSFVAVASFVTSYARNYLTQLILKAGYGNVLYCDTDSLFVTERGYDNLREYIGERELGKLEVRGVGEEMTIFAPKHYIFKGVAKIKGVPGKAVRIDDTTYRLERWLRGRSLLRRGITDRVLVEETEKKLRLAYDKGVVGEDGWVKPLLLSS